MIIEKISVLMRQHSNLKLMSVLRNGRDLIVIVLMIVIIALMIVPMPPWMLDILLSLNIGIAVSILVASFYLQKSTNISTFPSILLFATLFRISLNISSTRLILLNGYGGRIINAFGNFVVAGNFLVGAVIFVIITVVQYIVIAKGAERVAEVSARFALDAMPGKQMSIDADMRAGIIDAADARRLRNELEKESHFYGAMDGAMKFVKGDAIAGIIITLINITAGFLIGVGLKGMPLAEAGATYLILTIGDGLVAQIPALLISTSAGIVITRISAENDALLSKEVVNQIFNHPNTLIMTSVILIMIAFLPGFPFLSFSILSLLAGMGAYALRLKNSSKNEAPKPECQPKAKQNLQLAVPVLIELSPDLMRLFAMEQEENKLTINKFIVRLKQYLFKQTGLNFPEIFVRQKESREEFILRIYIKELPAYELRKLDLHDEIDNKQIKVRDKRDDILRMEQDKEYLVAEVLEDSIMKARRDVAEIAYIIYQVLSKYAYEFIGINEVQEMLDDLERVYPALVKNVIPKVISLQKLADVLRRLVKEFISIKDLKSILESLAEYAHAETDSILLTELVRTSLKRQIAWKYVSYNWVDGNLCGVLSCYVIEPKLEMILQEAIQHSPLGSFLALEPEISFKFINSCKQLFKNTEERIVVITQMEIRYFVKRLLETDFPDTIVLSYQELPSDIKIQPLDIIKIL